MGSEKLDTQVKIGVRSYRKPFIHQEDPKINLNQKPPSRTASSEHRGPAAPPAPILNIFFPNSIITQIAYFCQDMYASFVGAFQFAQRKLSNRPPTYSHVHTVMCKECAHDCTSSAHQSREPVSDTDPLVCKSIVRAFDRCECAVCACNPPP